MEQCGWIHVARDRNFFCTHCSRIFLETLSFPLRVHVIQVLLITRDINLAPNENTSYLKNTAFWDVLTYGFVTNQRFGRICRLHLQGRRNNASEEMC
jgi:hypothetical protein